MEGTCQACNGTGTIPSTLSACPVCGGDGVAEPIGVHDIARVYNAAIYSKLMELETKLDDAVDKIDDVMGKCDDIEEKVDEL